MEIEIKVEPENWFFLFFASSATIFNVVRPHLGDSSCHHVMSTTSGDLPSNDTIKCRDVRCVERLWHFDDDENKHLRYRKPITCWLDVLSYLIRWIHSFRCDIKYFNLDHSRVDDTRQLYDPPRWSVVLMFEKCETMKIISFLLSNIFLRLDPHVRRWPWKNHKEHFYSFDIKK